MAPRIHPQPRDQHGRFRPTRQRWPPLQAARTLPRFHILGAALLAVLAAWLLFRSPGNTLAQGEGVRSNSQEAWRKEACRLHERVRLRGSYDSPQPIHAVLGLDPMQPPFHPPENSCKEGQPAYRSLRIAIFDALAIRQKAPAERKQRDRLEVADVDSDVPWAETRGDDDESLYLLMATAKFLLDDEARALYVAVFIPIFAGSGMSGLFQDEKKIDARKEAMLMKLCRA
ncbi:hypothetical protein G7046_g5343 [Stylonectria norvegica]|nr:hypothetical protein G7046_g5343 [Stylonectria norvegica]